jgi:hypothetical protein
VKLYVESDLSFDPATAWEIFESDEFDARLEETTDLVCQVLDESMDGDVKVKRLRYTSKRDLPRVVAKALGSKNLTYEQVNRFNAATSELGWTVFLPVLSDRVSVSGTTTIKPTDTGSKRVVDGDISVRVRLIGGTIEKTVVAEFERSMSRAVDLARSIHSERNA